MVVCPIANSVGCEKCTIVNFCFLKTVLGDYGKEQCDQKTDDAESSKSKPPE